MKTLNLRKMIREEVLKTMAAGTSSGFVGKWQSGRDSDVIHSMNVENNKINIISKDTKTNDVVEKKTN